MSSPIKIDVSQLIIRTAQQQDLNSLAEVLTDSFHPPEGLKRWIYPVLKLGIYEDLRTRLRSQSLQNQCFVALLPTSPLTSENELTGTIEVALRSSWQLGSSQYAYISNLAVKEPYRRLGIARQLLLQCEHTARQWGFNELYLHVLENNYQARELYRNSGYQLESVEPSLRSWLFNSPKRLLLRKPLPS
ncbi:MAG: GNAT family N-acetyltransferase [Cyanobacteriota bacterium]